MSSFCKCKSYSHFVSKNISVYAIFNDQSFKDTLTNDIVSFEQLGLEHINQIIMKYVTFNKFFRLELTPFQKGGKTILTELSPLKVYIIHAISHIVR